MGWRPDNWEEIKPKKQSKGVANISEPNFDYGVEVGADAMLGALKREAQYGAGTDFENPAIEVGKTHTGWLIFIPKED